MDIISIFETDQTIFLFKKKFNLCLIHFSFPSFNYNFATIDIFNN